MPSRSRLYRPSILALSLMAGRFAEVHAVQQSATALPHVRSIDQWLLAKPEKTGAARLAIEGYDPVAYFPDFGGTATKGMESISAEHEGVLYRFSTQGHKEAFLANPARYEPAHGGWCSWAMASGTKTEINPKAFIVKDGRLFLFYKGFWGDTQTDWLKGDHVTLAKAADEKWKALSGEEPRTLAMTNIQSLQAALEAKKAEFTARAPAETSAIYEKGIKDVSTSGVLESAKKVGDAAPDFTLPDAKGGTVRLADLLAKGPVVLTWYRGGWCPYCNIQLRAYQERLEEMKAFGATLVAISPQTPDNSLTTAERESLTFHVASDAGNATAASYGLSYTLPIEVSNAFRGKLDLAKFNGNDSNTLPLSATYVVAQDGRIAYAYVNEDYRERAEPQAIIDALKALTAGKVGDQPTR